MVYYNTLAEKSATNETVSTNHVQEVGFSLLYECDSLRDFLLLCLSRNLKWATIPDLEH